MTDIAARGSPSPSPTADSAEAGRGDAPLNPFQHAMLLWERLHPYNAAHAVCWSGECDPALLRSSIEDACRAAGIGRLELNRHSWSVRYLPEAEIPIHHATGDATIRAGIERIVAQQLNADFPEPPHHPIRWSIVDGGAAAEYALLAVYRHVASDARGIELLLADVFRRYAGDPRDPAASITTRWPLGMTAARPPGLGRLTQNIARTVALYFKLRRSHKMPDEKLGGDRTQVALNTPRATLLPRLVAACRRRGAGLNDAMLAALCAAVARATPDRLVSRHRRGIALASAVSARRMLGAAAESYFGTLVGDMLVRVRRPDDAFDELLEAVAKQTRTQKTADWNAAMAASAARVFCIQTLWPLFRVPHDRRSYRKTFPVCGGVSTFVAGPPRFGSAAARITSYIRACPPGPAMPLVLAPTLWGDRLELSLVFREACMDQNRGEALLQDVAATLADFADQAG